MVNATGGGRQVVFRLGSATNQALTPRLGKDTVAPAGQQPGLSVEEALGSTKQKAQMLDLSRLRLPLKYFPDEVSKGGRAGHGVIAPVDEKGAVDQARLQEWASQREAQTDTPHPLTQLVLDALIERDVRSK